MCFGLWTRGFEFKDMGIQLWVWSFKWGRAKGCGLRFQAQNCEFGVVGFGASSSELRVWGVRLWVRVFSFGLRVVGPWAQGREVRVYSPGIQGCDIVGSGLVWNVVGFVLLWVWKVSNSGCRVYWLQDSAEPVAPT